MSRKSRRDEDGRELGKCRRRCDCLDGINGSRSPCCGWLKVFSRTHSDSNISSLGRISNILSKDPCLNKEFEVERFIVSKAMSMLSPHYVEDEKYPDTEPPSPDSDGRSNKSVLRDSWVELSYSGLSGHRCSYVQKKRDGKIVLLRKPLSTDSDLAVLADVNTVIQNHINKIIASETSETWHDRLKSQVFAFFSDTDLREVKRGESNGYNHNSENEGWEEEVVLRGSDGEVNDNVINEERQTEENSIALRRNSSSLSSDENADNYNQSSLQDHGHVLSKEKIHQLSTMDTFDMLDKLPSLSELIREELNIDNEFIRHHTEMLENYHKVHEQLRVKPKMDDRWFALVYTDNVIRGTKNHLYSFQYLVIRLILLTYCVAFEERDVSRDNTLTEFVERFQQSEVEARLPFVFSKGTSVGMSQEQYRLWRLRDPFEVKDVLTLQVFSHAFPRIHEFLAETPRRRKKALKSTFSQFHTCIFLIKQSQEYWELQLNRKYLDPNLRIYVLLKITVQKALFMLESLLENNRQGSQSSRKSRKSTDSRHDSMPSSGSESGILPRGSVDGQSLNNKTSASINLS